MNEEYRSVVGYEEYYEVSDYGNVRTLRNSSRLKKYNLMSQSCNTSGYLRVTLCDGNKKPKVRYVHHLVAEAFIGARGKDKELNHRDGNKLDNYVDNLEYVTRKENQIHASKMGLFGDRKGESHNCSKLKDKDILNIRFMLSMGIYQRIIADLYNVSQYNISLIKERKAWNHI